jgi:nucleotide-binding universal stress UspA family protein
VLVPLDGSLLAERALRTAGWLADELGADLHVVAADVDHLEAWWYRDYLDGLVAENPGMVAHRSADTDVAHAVHDLAAGLGPSVVCLASHGRARSAGLYGSTFASIAAAGVEPLVAVGPRVGPIDAAMRRRIVACVDGTPTSATILPPAAVWARRLDAGLTILTVAEPSPRPWIPGAQRERAYGPHGDVDEYLATLVDRPELAGLEVDVVVSWNPIGPDLGVLEHLDERSATMLAVTTHARTGLARAIVGSETARIVHGSPIPVLVHPVPASGSPGTAPAADEQERS